mmetsp:Transcript_25012/g.38830  ORF Transcript_25012/g.38830 Transcript_25012/m.38830 type:complete len:338 (+) Transcript_25012:228-1241(+)
MSHVAHAPPAAWSTASFPAGWWLLLSSTLAVGERYRRLLPGRWQVLGGASLRRRRANYSMRVPLLAEASCLIMMNTPRSLAGIKHHVVGCAHLPLVEPIIISVAAQGPATVLGRMLHHRRELKSSGFRAHRLLPHHLLLLGRPEVSLWFRVCLRSVMSSEDVKRIMPFLVSRSHIPGRGNPVNFLLLQLRRTSDLLFVFLSKVNMFTRAVQVLLVAILQGDLTSLDPFHALHGVDLFSFPSGLSLLLHLELIFLFCQLVRQRSQLLVHAADLVLLFISLVLKKVFNSVVLVLHSLEFPCQMINFIFETELLPLRERVDLLVSRGFFGAFNQAGLHHF